MQLERTHWAGRAGFPTAGVLRLPHDVLVEVACLLDVPALLSLRQVCRLLSALTREPVIFVRLLGSSRIPPLPRPVPTVSAPSHEQRVISACRLHKNWDFADFPITVRTRVASRAPVVRPSSVVKRAVVPVDPPQAAPLPYHLPPGADAYPFLKLETYAPFRDTVAKSKPSFGPVPTEMHASSETPPDPTDGQHTPGFTSGSSQASTSSLAQSATRPSHSHPHPAPRQSLLAPTPHPLPAGAGNWASATVRTWHASAPPDLGFAGPDATLPGSGLGPMHIPIPTARTGTPGPVNSAPSPPPAPAPRPTRVASVPARAILARIVAGGQWGVFVVKREPGSGLDASVSTDKGKQRADATLPLTAQALAHLSQDPSGKGKGKAVPVDEVRAAQWAESLNAVAATKSEGEPCVVIYDLDAVAGAPGKGRMAEYQMKWTPAGISCRATSTGLVIVLASGPKEPVFYTTILRWSYESPGITHLGSYKSKCPLGAISIQEYAGGQTLVGIVHRPTTVMIQDIDTNARCFVKLSKVPPKHTLQAIHLGPGPHLLVVRKVHIGEQDVQPFVLEEYALPPMGESVYPAKPIQRQWIRGMDLHSITLCEGPTYEGDAKPDIALWAFSTLPDRAMVHWVLRAGPKTGIGTALDTGPSDDIPSAHPTANPDQPTPEVPAIERDVYSDDPETVYGFPMKHIWTSRLSFPHHKATLAPGAQRALWFERPERSRSGEARGMRGIWAYTSIERAGLSDQTSRGGKESSDPVVRNCTREMPEDVLNSMESNTLGIAFDEGSGRVVVLTCGDSYGAASGSRIWVLDYA